MPYDMIRIRPFLRPLAMDRTREGLRVELTVVGGRIVHDLLGVS